VSDGGHRPVAERFSKAVTLHKAGRFDRAAAAYAAILEADPNHVAALVNLGQVERSRGRLDAAFACYRRATRMPGAGYEAWYNLANLHAQRQQAKAVERCLRAALILAPEQPAALSHRAAHLRDHGHQTSAETWFRRALVADWNQPLSHMALGNLRRDQGRLQEAYDRHMVALRLAGESWEVRYHLALTLVDLGDTARAAEHLAQALRRAPRPQDLHLGYARFLLSRRAYAAAKLRFAKTLMLVPDSLQALIGLGRCAVAAPAGADRPRPPARWFAAAAVAAGDDPAALSEIATGEWESGFEERATERLRRAAEAAPLDAQARHNLARALHRLWRAGPALAEARRALLLAPERSDDWSLLGVVLSKWARVEAALQAHGAARLIEPDNLGYVSSQAFTTLYSDHLCAADKAMLHRRLAKRIEAAAALHPVSVRACGVISSALPV
jgi:tetratricopeptide (TPR) repeat protein